MRRALPLALLLSGCTALGLTDVPPQGPCRDCEELNLIEPPAECESWRCGDEGVCVVDLIDRDGDGAPLARCALDERPADCDDGDADPRPGAAEVCDGRDNDCDERTDEELSACAPPDAGG